MVRMTRIFLTTFPFALIATLSVAGCSDDNEPSVADSDGSGGTSSSATTSTSSASSTSDTSSTSAGGNGSSTETSTTGSGTLGDPLCDLGPTAAGEEIKKGVACTDADPALCYRTCGPGSSGFKTEECSGGLYVEGDCQFPPGDYSCYKIPETVSEECPTDAVPQATEECAVPECTVCHLNGQYADSSGSVKDGYCVCNPPNSDGMRSWTCGSTTAWPCPSGNGC